DGAGIRVPGDLGGRRELALALSVLAQPDLGQGELVLDGPRPVAELPVAHRTVRRQDHPPAAIRGGLLPRVLDVPSEARGTPDVAGPRLDALQRPEQGVRPLLDEQAAQLLPFGVGGPALDDDLEGGPAGRAPGAAH